jgi:hypothetical protein
MKQNINKIIARDLVKLDNNPNLITTNPKIYTKSGLILESFAKLNKLSSVNLKALVKESPFFKLGKSKIKKGLFKKTEKSITIIEWTDKNELLKHYFKDSGKVLEESTTSRILIHRILGIINIDRSLQKVPPLTKSEKQDFQTLQEDTQIIYQQYFPDELEKYLREGKQESDLEKKFRKRMPKGSEFHFSDGKVAYNIMTWVQCLQMASNDVVVSHISNDDFYNWLDNNVKAPELARICMVLKKNLETGALEEKQVRSELLSNINKTSLNKIIYETHLAPLIKVLRSDDQSKVSDAIDRLINTGDDRIVEPLMEKVFNSSTQIRKKIIVGLGKLGDKRATPVILKVLKHSTDPEDRILAVKTLGNLKDKRSVKTLKGIAKSTDELGREATKALKNFE